MSSHFDFDNEICKLIKLDAPIQNGPVPRWQRRALESSICSNNGSISHNNSAHLSLSKLGTPVKVLNQSLLSQSTSKTPKSASNTPGTGSRKTPGKSKTPNKSLSNTPSRSCRFIPNREASNLDVGQYKVGSENEPPSSKFSSMSNHHHSAMVEQLNSACPESNNDRIFAFKERPAYVEGFQNSSKVLYSSTKKSEAKKKTRHIPVTSEQILDAPDLLDDYYLNLIDWSSRNQLAVALQGSMYIWDGNTGEANLLMSDEQYLSAVKWIPDGSHLALGTSNAEVQLWDVSTNKRLRNMTSHAGRVSSLSWNEFILSSGSKDGYIHHHDVRIANHHIKTLPGHSQEVCGLEWSPDYKYLASGGNDNLVNIYDDRATEPIQQYTEHQGAVKAIGWCPWQRSLLATGGGTSDRTIRLWDINSKNMVKSVDTNSQVCALKWSTHYKELISSHGYSQYQLTIWSYPSMKPVQDLLGHRARVLFLALSPDGTTVCSGSADETLRMWKCFMVDSRHRKKIGYDSSSSSSNVARKPSRVDAFTSLR